MKAVILAGGKGTRLAPYTTVLPKPLMPIADMPILALLLKQLKHHGVTDVILAIGYLGALIQAVIGDGHSYGLNVTYSTEEAPLGTAGPLHKIIDGLEGDFLVMNGDLLTTLNVGQFIQHHQGTGADITIATYRRDIKIDFGLIERDAESNFLGYIEKPTYQHHVSMGLYVIKADSVRNFLGGGEYLDMPNLILQSHAAGRFISCFSEDCFWLDIGRPDDYRLANEIYEQRPDAFLCKL
jgi:NDP-sugar pyrophosphorylase family protein